MGTRRASQGLSCSPRAGVAPSPSAQLDTAQKRPLGAPGPQFGPQREARGRADALGMAEAVARDSTPVPVFVDEAVGSGSAEKRGAVAASVFAPCSAQAVHGGEADVSEDPNRFLGIVLSVERNVAAQTAIVHDLRRRWPQTFVCAAVAEPSGSAVPCPAAMRHRLFEAGANMVSHVKAHVEEAKAAVLRARPTQAGGGLRCPVCRCGGLTEDQLWWHLPTFHISCRSATLLRGECPLCGKRGTKYACGVLARRPRHAAASPRVAVCDPACRPTSTACTGRGVGGRCPRRRTRWPPACSPSASSCAAGPPTAGSWWSRNLRAPASGCPAAASTRVRGVLRGSGTPVRCRPPPPPGHVRRRCRHCPRPLRAGELLSAGAIRETVEEAGVHVNLTGVLRIEYRPR